MTNPTPTDIEGEWLETWTGSGTGDCGDGTSPIISSYRIMVIGDQAYAGQGADCNQALLGTLAGNTVTFEKTERIFGPQCAYTTIMRKTRTFTGSSFSGTYHYEHANVSGDCTPCVADGTYSGARCSGCSGCPGG